MATNMEGLESTEKFEGYAPVKLVACPRVGMSFSGKYVEPGDEVEVFGERNIAYVGSMPEPNNYYYIELYKQPTDNPYILASVDGKWYKANSKEVAVAASGHPKHKKARAKS